MWKMTGQSQSCMIFRFGIVRGMFQWIFSWIEVRLDIVHFIVFRFIGR